MEKLKSFRDKITGTSAEDFISNYPLPALLLSIATIEQQFGEQATATSRLSTTRTSLEKPDSSYPEWVAWLEKSKRNYFENLVIVGRSPMNDICLPVNTVSKIHAFFSQIGDQWHVNHHGSTNGLSVNDLPVEGGQNIPLHDGDKLGLGPSVTAFFFTAPGLFQSLELF